MSRSLSSSLRLTWLLPLSLVLSFSAPLLAQSAPHPPAGHPQVGGMQTGRPQDSSSPDPNLPAGTIQVRVLDAASNPVPGAEVELTTLFQSIDKGNSESSSKVGVGPDGTATFSNLRSELRLSYQARVKSQGALYELPAFRLTNVGHSLTFHVYPTTSSVKEALVGFRGLVYVQMREDSFHITAMYRVLNMGNQTYLPQGINISLPEDAEAIDVETKVGDAGFSKSGRQVSLVGTFPPGHKDLQFTFQIPNKNKSNIAFELGSPPHLAEQRILVEETPGMDLSVPGFSPVESTQGPDGKQVLFAQKVMQAGEGQLQRVRVELGGLPTIGPGRWVAVAIAFCIGLGGLVTAVGRRGDQSEELQQQRKAAREVLLKEMQLLETARREDKIGPRTYEQTRREIVLALARLDQPSAA